MLAPPDYNSAIWIHIEQHVEVHCFGDFNTDPGRRARHLAQKRPAQIIKAIREAAEDIAGEDYLDNTAIYNLMNISLSEGFSSGMVQSIHIFLSEISSKCHPKIQNYLNYMTAMPDLEESKDSISNLIFHIKKLHDARGKMACELLISARALIEVAENTLRDDPLLACADRRAVIKEIDAKKHKWQTFE